VKIEGKKHAFRQTQDGVVISFVLHPNDVTPELAVAPLGTPYEIELTEIDYDNPRPEPTEGEKIRTRAVMMCKDPNFQKWVVACHRPIDGGYVYADEYSARAFILEKCGIASRSELASNKEAQRKFLEMETQYMQDTGRMARPR